VAVSTSEGRLIVVSNRAPVEVAHGPEGLRITRTVGGLASALDDAMRERHGVWIAWAGSASDELLTREATGLPYPVRPVRLKEREVNNYYAGFSNQVLWPLCHTFPTRCRFVPGYWVSYRHANEVFATEVQATAEPGDMIWVNDFHLCLVPGLLRAANVAARVGLFWHIPFPPPSVFGICRWREELLEGLLGADVIGLQTDEDAQNFLECVNQFLGRDVAADPPRVRLPDRDVRVVALPIGIDAARFRQQAADPGVREQAARLRATLGTEVVMIGVDRLDYTKGILERLLGFERFLERQPRWRRRVSLVQITVPSRDRVPDYREMKRSIDETAGRIIGRYTYDARSPLAYLYTAFSHERLAAYYLAADIALVTPLRDGMNLVAKEYVACHGDSEGVLILSEFAGAAREMREAVLVNPYDPEAIRRQIEVAVEMSHEERRSRMEALTERVYSHDIAWWTSTFLRLVGDPAAAAAPCPSR
jgi:trehalose 6-phosphate synthase/phosphatase